MSQPTPAQIKAMMEEKKREIQQRLQAMRPSPAPLPPSIPASSAFMTDDLQKRIEAAKARVKAATEANAAQHPGAMSESAVNDQGVPMVGSVLDGVAIDGMQQKNKLIPMLPKAPFATVKANQRAIAEPMSRRKKKDAKHAHESIHNPYYTPKNEVMGVRERKARPLRFAEPGHFIEKADQIRTQEKLEQLRQKIAQDARKAGFAIPGLIMDEAMESEEPEEDRLLRTEMPPEVEWWDKQLFQNEARTYADLDDPMVWRDLVGDGSQVVTVYVHHPVPIQPPGFEVKPREVMLTKKERKKLKRQRRMEAHRDKLDKIRLGLLPPEKPRIKMSNLMKVMTNEAIQDPTLLEERVRREAQARLEKHLRENAERKLTDEERREKAHRKLEEDAAKGIHIAVFRIDDLSHPKLLFKVRKNAQQWELTGILIRHPDFSMVIVEGGAKAMKGYKKLMMHRIKWSEDYGPPNSIERYQQEEAVIHGDSNGKDNAETVHDEEDTMEWSRPERVGPNHCVLVWEGMAESRRFFGFRTRRCPTDADVKERLSRAKAEKYWDLCRAVDVEEKARFAQGFVAT